MANDWAVPIDLTDAYLHVPIRPRSRKYLQLVYEHQVFQFTALSFGTYPKFVVFTKLMNVIAAHIRLHAVSLFPYLDNWLIRDLIRNWLIITQNTLFKQYKSGFHTKSKKSDLIPTQKFTFIGMKFLIQQKIVRVPANRVKALILTGKTSLSQTQVLARTFLSLLGKQCSSNFSRQTAFTTSANVLIICLETSHSSLRSSGYN